MAVISLLISLLFLLTAYQISDGYETLRTATREYYDLRESAYELQAASDYLTDQARNFAMTGDRVYLDNYFHEAQDIRRRERALEALRSVGEDAEAYRDLELAMEESVELMDTEYLSMYLMVLASEMDLSKFPESVQNVVLPEEYRGMNSGEQLEMARELVLNEQYLEKKNAISRDMKACLIELMRGLDQREAAAQTDLMHLIVRLQIMGFALIALVLLRILITSRLVIGPLLTGVLYIQEGQQLPIRGAYEFRFLARTYNQMYLENKAQTEQLTFEAQHDKLTGVYNRSGYDSLMSQTDLSTSALLLVDVDKFKEVNDTYGHKTGDRALIRVANALQNSFHNEDHVCRIGGDEFAVIMEHTGPESRGQIEKKITQINKKLRWGGGDMPSLSVSVGCAFGGAQNSTGAIDKDADAALYRVKENGRCGCAFY